MGEQGEDESRSRPLSTYRDRMLVFVATVVLYVFGFVFLYGVIRVGVRHGIQDAEANRPEPLQRRHLTEV